jgi:hypothetical protein
MTQKREIVSQNASLPPYSRPYLAVHLFPPKETPDWDALPRLRSSPKCLAVLWCCSLWLSPPLFLQPAVM